MVCCISYDNMILRRLVNCRAIKPVCLGCAMKHSSNVQVSLDNPDCISLKRQTVVEMCGVGPFWSDPRSRGKCQQNAMIISRFLCVPFGLGGSVPNESWAHS